MAKGNLFLGTAARSVGDVVMYRREGSQVSRVRVRKIANPRTDAQSLQRAAFSPVAKFFSPLAVVLERAWEGVSKSKSYSEFLKENVKRARQNGWLLPKGTSFFPLPYQLTKGTLPVLDYSSQSALNVEITGATASTNTIGALSTLLIAMGYKKDDIITFIVVKGNKQEIRTSNFVPMTAQFVIKTDDNTTFDNAFAGFVPVRCIDDVLIIGDSDAENVVAGAVIVARFENDKWRRSTQDLAVHGDIISAIGTAAYKAAAVASYGNTAGSINPLVYLDGKDLED